MKSQSQTISSGVFADDHKHKGGFLWGKRLGLQQKTSPMKGLVVMKKLRILLFALACVLAQPISVLADAQVNEWIGKWTFSLDGRPGVFEVVETKADCASSPWCNYILRYTDDQGKQFTGTINKIDNKFQHMSFTIKFDNNNNQKFDSYLFSWDKNKMAGTTVWGGRTFGFFATK